MKNASNADSHLKAWHAALRWLGLCLISAVLAGCGGGSSDTASASPDAPPPPPAATQAFTLLPARLGLGTDDDGLLVALAPPGAVVWSSSDPRVASVDALARANARSSVPSGCLTEDCT